MSRNIRSVRHNHLGHVDKHHLAPSLQSTKDSEKSLGCGVGENGVHILPLPQLAVKDLGNAVPQRLIFLIIKYE